MIIDCEGFTLRPPQVTDFESYYENVNDPNICQNLRNINYPVSIEDAKISCERAIIALNAIPRTKEIFVIDIKSRCAGIIQLADIEMDHKAKIGYWLGARYQGNGIMTKAVDAVTRFGFEEHNLRRIYAQVVTSNISSARVLERCGYTLEGILKMNRLKNDKYYDDYIYAITR